MQKPTEDLAIALQSEVLGEAFFRSAYYFGWWSNHSHKVKMLWQLETQTKKRILEYFEVNNIEIPKLSRTVTKGSILGAFCVLVPWSLVLKQILKETEYYQTVFRRLEGQMPKKNRELFRYIVAHEVAIGQFASIELLNGNNNSLDRVEALL